MSLTDIVGVLLLGVISGTIYGVLLLTQGRRTLFSVTAPSRHSLRYIAGRVSVLLIAVSLLLHTTLSHFILFVTIFITTFWLWVVFGQQIDAKH